jgi:hypothetical protein
VSARWTDGDDDTRIDVILRRRVVRAAFQPIVRLEPGLTAGYHASVRGPLGSPLEHEGELFAVAAHRGVSRHLDDLRFQTILEAAQRAKLAAPVTVFVSRTVDAVLAAPLVVRTGAFPIAIVLDAQSPDERLAYAATRVRAEGCAIALRDVPPTDEATALLADVPPEFVIVERGVSVPDGVAHSDATLIASGIDYDADVTAALGTGVEFGFGQRFGRPDLLVRPPAIFDHDGFGPSTAATPAAALADERR